VVLAHGRAAWSCRRFATVRRIDAPYEDVAAQTAILLLSCPDRVGVVRDVATYVAGVGANILHAEQHLSDSDDRFFQRLELDLADVSGGVDGFAAGFETVAAELDATWSVHLSSDRAGIGILVSRQAHCLYDLLARWRIGDIPGDVRVVVSNHPDHADVARSFGLPFHHLPVTADTKAEQEARVREILSACDVELVILARYMQILTAEFVDAYTNRIINIHHSMLPAFKGGRPYHQAHERGVKVIGATAHYASADLDEGPIIEQDVVHVSHRDGVEDLVRRGRELENNVLARAVRAHLEHRVVVTGRRTIVFG
jgi:formyltetrahydrofolate deformylase